MRFGVTLPLTNPDGSALNSTALTEYVRTIERLGFRSLWCFESIGRGSLLPDPLIAVSVAAAVTTHIEGGGSHQRRHSPIATVGEIIIA